MVTKTLAQIPPSPVPPVGTDQFVAVTGGPTDVLFSFAQLEAAYPEGATGPQGLPGLPGPPGPPGTVSGVPDPLILTQGLSLTAADPTIGSDPNFRRAAQVIATFDQLNSNIGFTDQVALAATLNFNAGYNQYGGAGNVNAKYTPIALAASGTYYGAGEKFVQSWNGNMYSMGDSFLWSGTLTYTGGPINGDEGQAFTPAMYCTQPNALVKDTITAVHRTTYNTTITANVTASYIAQDIPVASTVGASVGDWVIINQQLMAAGTRIWAMQIQSINPGVSIHGVCAINALIGDTIKPALCLNTTNGGSLMGEGRVIINDSGTHYSTGVVASVSGGGFTGSGTTWTNTMVGGDALNIGSVWLTVDNVTSSPFSVGSPCRSVYQIIQIASPTQMGIFTFTVAGGTAYQGRGQPPATNLAYTIVPSARVMLNNPPGGGFNLICEYSAHTWNIGDSIECVFCPYPDLHGFDWRIGCWTAGGAQRQFIGLLNIGARMMQNGIFMGPRGGIGANADFDTFAWNVGLSISSAQVGISVNNTSNLASYAFLAQSSGNDIGASINLNGVTITPKAANAGADIQLITTGSGGLLRSTSNTFSADVNQSQLVWTGYLQVVSGGSGAAPYLRIGGNNIPGTHVDTVDLSYVSAPRSLKFIFNESAVAPSVTTFELNSSGLLKFGNFPASGSDLRLTLDAITNLTAARTVTVPDVTGGLGVVVPGLHTPASSTAAGRTGMIEFDGTYLYVCVGTNVWVRSALTGGW